MAGPSIRVPVSVERSEAGPSPPVATPGSTTSVAPAFCRRRRRSTAKIDSDPLPSRIAVRRSVIANSATPRVDVVAQSRTGNTVRQSTDGPLPPPAREAAPSAPSASGGGGANDGSGPSSSGPRSPSAGPSGPSPSGAPGSPPGSEDEPREPPAAPGPPEADALA